jgi:hypothetical protein
MGCCSSAPLDTTIVFEGTTKHVANCTIMTTLRVQIGELFPQLSDVLFEMVDKEGNNWTQKAYQAALQEHREATVSIRRLVPYAFKDPEWEHLSASVFRLVTKYKVCIATGFMISPTLGLTSWMAMKGVELQGLKAHFDKPVMKDVNIEATTVLKIAPRSQMALTLLRLKEPQNCTFIKLDRSVNVEESEPTTTIFVMFI